jgi:hypothetical protein
MSQLCFPPERLIALDTFPGPELYDANTFPVSKNRIHIRHVFCSWLSILADHFVHQHKNQSSDYIAFQFDTQSPVAPILETAFGFNADSTIDKYFISNGTFSLAKASSNMGNNIQR